MKDLTKGNIYKVFFSFGLPLVLSGLLSQFYGIVDTAIAGQIFGDVGLAAIGATAPFITFISSVFWGYGVGFSIYVARLFSAKEYKKIKNAVYSNYLFMGIIAVAISVLAVCFNGPLFTLLQIEESLRPTALAYFFIYVLGLFPIIMTANGLYIMNAFGESKYPFMMSIISMLLNIGGNLFFVLVLGMGIEGLALASVIAATVVFLLYFIKFRSFLKELGVHKERVQISFACLKNSVPYALPNMLQQMSMYFASLAISPMVNGLGPAATASYSVSLRVYDIVAAVYQNSARCISNYSAQCVGKNNCEKIRKGVFVGLIQGIAFATPFILAFALFHEPLCSLFLKADASALTKEYVYAFCKYYLPFIYFNLVCNLFHGLYRGTKATGYLFASTLTGAFSRLVYSALLIPSMGMYGFFLGWLLSWVTESVFTVLLFFFGKWNPGNQPAVQAENSERENAQNER